MKQVVATILILSQFFLFLPSISVQAQTATIQATLSQTLLTPGASITLSGDGFGNNPSNPQICFGQSICSTSSTIADIITQWSNTSIRVVVPYANIPSGTNIRITNGTQTIVSNTFTYEQRKPSISSYSPSLITANSTVMTINGTNLRSYDNRAQVCINNNCIVEAYIQEYIQEWNDTTIRLTLPYVPYTSSFSLRIDVPIYTTPRGNSIVEMLSIQGLQYTEIQDPIITSISPTTVLPGQTIIRIVGKGFEDAYRSGWHSLCFNDMCLSDQAAQTYILSWSDTEVTFTVPKEFSIAKEISVSLYLQFPNASAYRPVYAPENIILESLPTVTQYTSSTTTGGGVLLLGTDFGEREGTLRLEERNLQITEWSDTRIEGYIPTTGVSGDMIIRSADGRESLPIPLTVRPAATYSQDMYSYEQWYLPVIRMVEAWRMASLTTPITIAVLDSGVDFAHEDLIGSSWINTDEIPNNGIDDDNNGYVDDAQGWNFVTQRPDITPIHEHGTMVASTIVAKKDNLIGFAGIAPNAKIMSLVVTAPTGSETDPNIPFEAAQEAMKYAIDNGARIINMSFSGETPEPLYREVAEYAYKHNVLVVAASGNTGTDLSTQAHSPVCDDGENNEIIGVASTGRTNEISSFANVGRCIDIFAPGEDIFVSLPSEEHNNYGYASGTSFAAPIVTGVAALLWSMHPDWNVEEIKHTILNSTRTELSYPMLDALATLMSSRPTVGYTPSPDATLQWREEQIVIPLDTPEVDPVIKDQNQPNTSTFPDVPASYTYFTAIEYLFEKGIIQGYPDGLFRPERNINRAEFLKIILEAKGFIPSTSYANCFADVSTDWYAPYVCFARQQGFVEGYPEANLPRSAWSFRPDQTINKVEALKILLNVFEIDTVTSSSNYTDISTSAWYSPYVAQAETLGLLSETGFFFPDELMRRGKISEITYRLLYIQEQNIPRF